MPLGLVKTMVFLQSAAGTISPNGFMPQAFGSGEQVSATASRSFDGRLFEAEGTML